MNDDRDDIHVSVTGDPEYHQLLRKYDDLLEQKAEEKDRVFLLYLINDLSAVLDDYETIQTSLVAAFAAYKKTHRSDYLLIEKSQLAKDCQVDFVTLKRHRNDGKIRMKDIPKTRKVLIHKDDYEQYSGNKST